MSEEDAYITGYNHGYINGRQDNISEFLEDLERNCICYDSSQTERNVLKLIEKWEKRL